MLDYDAQAPPCTLADRLRALNDSLKALAIRLKDAIASAVSSAIGQVVRDLIRRLLGEHELSEQPRPFDRRFDLQARERSTERFQHEDDPWHEDPWLDDRPEAIASSHDESSEGPNRWGEALRTTVQTALWWLRIQPCRHPMLTTVLVALSAGAAAFFAGPTLAACVSVVATVTSLLLTADSARTAGEVLTSTLR
jgi:hypothetical protein